MPDETPEDTAERLQEVIDMGVASVTMGDKTVNYRSRGELKASARDAQIRAGQNIKRQTRWRRNPD